MIHVIQSVGSLASEIGGPSRSVGNLSVALAESGVKVTLLTPDFEDILSPPIIPDHELITFISVPIQFRVGMQAYWIPGIKKILQKVASKRERLL